MDPEEQQEPAGNEVEDRGYGQYDLGEEVDVDDAYAPEEDTQAQETAQEVAETDVAHLSQDTDATTAEEGTAYRPTPPAFSAAGLTPEQEQQINDLYLSNPAAAMRLIVQHEMRQAQLAASVADYHLNEVEAQAPEFYRVHGATVRRALAQMDPAQRGTRQAVHAATVFALLEEANATGDLKSALVRAARLMTGGTDGNGRSGRPQLDAPSSMEGQRPQATASKTPAKPAPPAQRVPTPGVSAGAARSGGSVRPVASKGGDLIAQRLQQSFGLTRGTASRVVEDL